MYRLHVAYQTVAMGTDGVDQVGTAACLFQQLRGLETVLLRPHLKVDVVQQTGGGPEIRVLAIAQLVDVPAHHTLDGQRVLDMERLVIVLLQCRQSGIPTDNFLHCGKLPFVYIVAHSA